MRKLKRILAVSCVAMLIVTAAGCSGTEAASETASESTQEETTEAENTTDAAEAETSQTDTAQAASEDRVIGKVTAIDGSTITLALGEMPQAGAKGDMELPSGDGTAPSGDSADAAKEKPSQDGQAPSGEAPSGDAQAPSGEAPSGDAQAPSGEAPAGDGTAPDMSSLFEESGETLTITVDDESVIKVVSGGEETTGSLSDIAVDTILSIEYDASGEIASILIQK
ncbi:hypothetical protein [Konateibacter massiliensis]|uniref:hypothetical protein n=1 Tax=Konateibacter massiliensis TaxID=2002841 RepID=UPI000C14CCDF|nr:hypothetical protein [Konateibacter massiliensis]